MWKIEGEAINALQRKGVDVDSVKLGERVGVVGAMSRYGRPECSLVFCIWQMGVKWCSPIASRFASE